MRSETPHPRSNAQGLAAYAILIERKRSNRRKLRLVIGLGFLLLGVLGGLEFTGTATGLSGILSALPFLMMLMAILLAATFSEPRLTASAYKQLPGAVDARGGHACIACGHRGIYRRTIYRTTTVLANCSRCEAPLWKA